MKKYTLFLSTVLILSLIAGCTGEKNQDPPYSTDSFGNPVLSAEMEKTIKLAYLDAYAGRHIPTDSIDMAFYGEFNGAYAVYVMGLDSTATLGSETVEGITFWYPTFSETMCIYYEGKCCRLQEAFDRGLLTLEDLKTLENNYPFNDQFDPTEPTTTPPETTAPTETTVPPTTAVVNSYCDLPQITVAETLTTLPNKPALTDLVTTGYEGGAQWVDLCSNVETVTIQLPAITPFSKDAIAINKEIQDTFSPILEDVKGYYDQQVSTFVYTVSYEAWLSGDILSILITRDTPFDSIHYHIFTLDITTGKALPQPELISRVLNVSYPEFLYHATYTAYDHFHERDSSHGPLTDAQNEFLTQLESSAGYISQYQLYLGENGTPMLCNPRPGELYDSIELPYDAAAHGNDPEKAENKCYRWLFSMKPVTTYGTLFEENQNEAWARLLKKCFDCDSVKMLQYLSAEDAACIDRVTTHLIKGVSAEDRDAFASQCQNLTQHSDPSVAQLAQSLLSILADY